MKQLLLILGLSVAVATLCLLSTPPPASQSPATSSIIDAGSTESPSKIQVPYEAPDDLPSLDQLPIQEDTSVQITTPGSIASREEKIRQREEELERRAMEIDRQVKVLETLQNQTIAPPQAPIRDSTLFKRSMENAFRDYMLAKDRYEGDARASSRSWVKFPFEMILFQSVGWQFAPRPRPQDPYARQDLLRSAAALQQAIEDYLPFSTDPKETDQLQVWLTNLEALLGPSGIPDPATASPQPSFLPGVDASPAQIGDFLRRRLR